MNTISFKYIALFFFTAVLCSCEAFVDTEPPKIERFTVNGEEAGSEPVVDTLSTDILIVAYMTDNEGLFSYKLGFDYVGVDNSPGLRFPPYLVREDTFAIAGAQTEISKQFRVASAQTTESLYAASGEYEIYMAAKDRSFNNSTTTRFAIEFRNYAPYFKFPDYEKDSIEVKNTETITINAYMDDLDNNMNNCFMLMYLKIPTDTLESGFYDSLVNDFMLTPPVPGAGKYDVSEMYNFPDTGQYELRMNGLDQRRNSTLASIYYHVNP
ncbi:hypothetical protein [Flammeovirga pacifica]|uniref:DUF4397 domain-containing protein n=1 Tax=Flammeovirga pacifica TaxID=915059 RepID=A0A1S1Z239_FLAPC|nr:hypothetical protein [Flammeovirga pacifica]OHX67336.1 hypothetical protein NH26_13770 [Flammeovirga pacifica]